MTPAISVVITCYNLERYIAEAIESALGQKTGLPFEVIVVDDCSTDASAKVIARYDQVINASTGRNSGVLLATLTGIERASADIVMFLDGDDIWEEDKLARVAAAFASDPTVGFVTHDLSYIDSDGVPLDRRSRSSEELGPLGPEEQGEAVRDGILTLGDFVWLGSAFAVRRSVGRIDDFVDWARALPAPADTYQDWPLAYWVAALPDAGFAYVPDKLFRYRLHQQNHSGDSSSPDKMRRNLRRALNTNEAIRDIVAKRALPAGVRRAVDRRIGFFAYLADLHAGRRVRAVGGFVQNLPYLARRGLLLKEGLRFLAVEAAGPDAFARIAARRSRLRGLPTS